MRMHLGGPFPVPLRGLRGPSATGLPPADLGLDVMHDRPDSKSLRGLGFFGSVHSIVGGFHLRAQHRLGPTAPAPQPTTMTQILCNATDRIRDIAARFCATPAAAP